MPYATPSDITTAYGPDALFAADRDGDGAADAGIVEAALADASAEIDSFLANRYSLPLDGAHAVLTRICIDIAIYRMASTADVVSDAMRTRFEDAQKALHDFSSGKRRLVMPDPEAEEGEPSIDGPQPIVQDGPPAIFGRNSTRGL